MEQLIHEHLRNLQRKSGDAPKVESKALTVDEVARGSIAGQAGIQPGDLLTHVDGTPSILVEFETFLDPAQSHQYRFFSPRSRQEISFETSGAPIGVVTEKMTSELERQVKRNAVEDGPLLTAMWNRSEWEVLLRCAKKSQRGKLLERLLGDVRNTPATLLAGAALYEQGNRAEGLELIREYMSKYEQDWTTNYHAIARYYLAQKALEDGDRDAAIKLLREAFGFSSMDRIADQLESLTGERPQKDKQWVGEIFPDYTLPAIDGDQQVSFRETLDRVGPGEIFLICLLATYRANGPYHDFMKRYQRVATHLGGVIKALHVITMTTERDEFADHWLLGEDTVRRQQLPCEVLYDGDGKVTRSIRPNRSPMKFAVASSGVVLEHGSILGDVELWDIIDKAASSV